jgi:hypothetical protein
MLVQAGKELLMALQEKSLMYLDKLGTFILGLMSFCCTILKILAKQSLFFQLLSTWTQITNRSHFKEKLDSHFILTKQSGYF